MAYSVAHQEECLRNAINNKISYPESQEVAHIYVDEYIQKIATDANFEIMADHLISMQFLTRYDILLCSPSSGSSDDVSFLGEGMFCECDQYKNVESTPIAQGSKNVTKFQMALWKCELAGLSVSSDKYYTPDGTSESCVFVPPEYRYIACFDALMGTVTQCE
ncbi:MAG: hypothetical protein KBC27_01310 [Rickettsiales bacterium]|nr:hypothetical protein [Rickettsiales bacterium]